MIQKTLLQSFVVLMLLVFAESSAAQSDLDSQNPQITLKDQETDDSCETPVEISGETVPGMVDVVKDFLVETLVVKNSKGKLLHFKVEVADTPRKAMQGLMYRKSMEEDRGMLFIFPHERPRNFWMKNTVIPLDILFIKADGVIHHIHENAEPFNLTPLPSNGPVSEVLEINGGLTKKLGIKPGDIVYHSAFGNALAQ